MAREAGVAILRADVVAAIFADCLVKPVDRDEGEAICLNKLPHSFDIMVRRKQFFALGRINTIKTAVPGWRARNPHMDFARARIAHHEAAPTPKPKRTPKPRATPAPPPSAPRVIERQTSIFDLVRTA